MPYGKKHIWALIAGIILIAAIFVFKIPRGSTITGYKDENFVIYDCARPIKAKQGSVPDLMGGRIETLVPASEQEAKQYCQATGIE